MSRLIKYKLPLRLISIILLLSVSENAMAITGEFLLSDKKYQANIKVEAYILSEQQVASLFCTQSIDIKQMSHKELLSTENYFFIRMKNIGDKAAWGKLSVKVDKREFIELQVPFLGANMKKYSIFLIPCSSAMLIDDQLPVITFHWEKMYSK